MDISGRHFNYSCFRSWGWTEVQNFRAASAPWSADLYLQKMEDTAHSWLGQRRLAILQLEHSEHKDFQQSDHLGTE
jgi:hypothetical protein